MTYEITAKFNYEYAGEKFQDDWDVNRGYFEAYYEAESFVDLVEMLLASLNDRLNKPSVVSTKENETVVITGEIEDYDNVSIIFYTNLI